jgi:hypothetical protein
LAAFEGPLHLDGLQTLPADVARELSAHKRGFLTIDGLPRLDADAARALALFRGQYLTLRGVTRLDADAAKALVAFRGHELTVGRPRPPGGTMCGRLMISCGGGSNARELHLDALTTLDGDTAEVLVGFEGQLHLDGLAALDADAAKALAASKAWTGSLPGLTAFSAPDSVAVATALATRQGKLALPNLEKISPKTLSALIEKEDVEIPLVEKLELIAEPDGSPTEDFVIPAALQERQRRAAKPADF